jgi:hypothetical protein
MVSVLRLAAFTLLVTASSSLYARSLDINLSNDSAQFKYASLVGATTFGRTEVGYGFLYNNDHDLLGEISLLVIDEAGSKSPGLELGVGPKLYIAEPDDPSVSFVAIGLGGQMRYKNLQVPRVVYGASLFYAPSIVAFGDADQMYEFEMRIEYELLPTANVYLGYRSIQADIKNRKDITVDESAVVGLRFKF